MVAQRISRNDAVKMPVWFMRIKRLRCEWHTMQAGINESDATQRFLAGYENCGIDVSDYKILEVKPATWDANRLYYANGKEQKVESL